MLDARQEGFRHFPTVSCTVDCQRGNPRLKEKAEKAEEKGCKKAVRAQLSFDGAACWAAGHNHTLLNSPRITVCEGQINQGDADLAAENVSTFRDNHSQNLLRHSEALSV